MENSWTARPTCDRVLYYYGDFSGALCFAPTVKTEQRENTEGKLSHAEGKQWAESRVIFQRLRSFRLLQQCTKCKKKIKNKLFPSSAGSESFTLYYSNPRNLLREKWAKQNSQNQPNYKTKSILSQTIQITSLQHVSWRLIAHISNRKLDRGAEVSESTFAYHFWAFYWYPCQKRSVCDLACPIQAPSGLLKTMTVSVHEESWSPVAGTGPGAHSAHCCGWSFERCGDCPNYQWRGTLARHHSLHHPSPRDQAEEIDESDILWRRCKEQRWGREGASLFAHVPLGWPHTPRGLPGGWLDR